MKQSSKSREKRFIVQIVALITAGLIFPSYLQAQVNFTSSDLPIIIIETLGQEIQDKERITAVMQIINNPDNCRNSISDSINGYNGYISIEIRGSSSQAFPKKQYGFETQLKDGSNNNVSLLSLPSENDWILSAPYSDKTLIRNVLAFQLSNRLGHYAPRTEFCELILNGKYQGVYILTEKIKRDENRINISKLNPEDVSGDELTGGYIIKRDKRSEDDPPAWHSRVKNTHLQHVYPKYKDIQPEQISYIQNYMNDFENSLFSEHFKDTLTGYQKYIDINSFIDFFIINEVSKNIDAYFLSTFLYKDKDSNGGKLKAGPVWDFNIAFGNADFRNGYLPEGLIATNEHWWNRLLEDSCFTQKLNTRWQEIRQADFSNENILDLIDSLSNTLEESQKRNFQKWDVIGHHTWPNYYVGSSYEEEIHFLKSWIVSRLNWLDYQLPNVQPDNNLIHEVIFDIYPNPFVYSLNYSFSLEKAGGVSIRLYDSKGKLVSYLIPYKYYREGTYAETWNSFVNGNLIPNGTYILVFFIEGQQVCSKKIVKRF